MPKQKKVLVSLLLIGVIAAAAVGGTIAFFFARRTTTANRFTAGTLDLNVSSNGQALEPFVIDNMGENGNISGTKTWVVKNTGTLPGRVFVRLQNVANQENGCNDQEKNAESACEADTEGELGGVVIAKVAWNGTDRVQSTLATADQSTIGLAWNALPDIVLAPGEEKNLTIHWATDENGYGNEVQSDSLSFDLDVRLVQLISGPTPTNQ